MVVFAKNMSIEYLAIRLQNIRTWIERDRQPAVAAMTRAAAPRANVA